MQVWVPSGRADRNRSGIPPLSIVAIARAGDSGPVTPRRGAGHGAGATCRRERLSRLQNEPPRRQHAVASDGPPRGSPPRLHRSSGAAGAALARPYAANSATGQAPDGADDAGGEGRLSSSTLPQPLLHVPPRHAPTHAHSPPPPSPHARSTGSPAAAHLDRHRAELHWGHRRNQGRRE